VHPSALFTIALRSLSRNKLRSFLTMLGIVIGVAAVIAMLAVGQGARASVESSIASLGSNVINVFPGALNQSGIRLEAGSASRYPEADAEAVRREDDAVLYITPVIRTGVQLKVGGQNWRTNVYGVYPEYLLIRKWDMATGASFAASDERGATKVCLLGKTVASNLFGEDADAVGRAIRVKNVPFRVVGILESKGQNAFGQDQDDIVLAPYSTVQRKILGGLYAQSFLASAVSEDAIPVASGQIEETLRRRMRVPEGSPSEFTLRTQTEIAQAATSTSRALTVLLASIAAISLLVGGIGIMNIMLVSVTERTREIGIRLAVGAQGRDILLQFLVEALVMSFIGGLLGVVLGVGVSGVLSSAQGWAVRVSPLSIAAAFGFSAATGIFFGWYPARKAARMNPIEALRYE
jgi:putative ABC transport system permease protein